MEVAAASLAADHKFDVLLALLTLKSSLVLRTIWSITSTTILLVESSTALRYGKRGDMTIT